MIIQHNNTALTKLRPSPGPHHLSVHFDFLTEEEQLAAAIGQSEHCEQELSYRCRKSRLLNTPGEAWMRSLRLSLLILLSYSCICGGAGRGLSGLDEDNLAPASFHCWFQTSSGFRNVSSLPPRRVDSSGLVQYLLLLGLVWIEISVFFVKSCVFLLLY